MFLVTLSSLFIFAWKNFAQNSIVLGIVASLLFVLSVVLILLARKSLKAVVGE
jgi:carbon starvation protein